MSTPNTPFQQTSRCQTTHPRPRESKLPVSRREFIKLSGAMGAGLAAWPLASLAAQAGGKSDLPNLIVFISDDHGMLYSEPYGCTDIHTPNLTRLAADGMAVVAHVVPRPGATLSERVLRRHCHVRLEPWLVPKIFTISDALPKSDTGKITKAALRAAI